MTILKVGLIAIELYVSDLILDVPFKVTCGLYLIDLLYDKLFPDAPKWVSYVLHGAILFYFVPSLKDISGGLQES
jgi:hypothetical protein